MSAESREEQQERCAVNKKLETAFEVTRTRSECLWSWIAIFGFAGTYSLVSAWFMVNSFWRLDAAAEASVATRTDKGRRLGDGGCSES